MLFKTVANPFSTFLVSKEKRKWNLVMMTIKENILSLLVIF
jgi:hypothetical protein